MKATFLPFRRGGVVLSILGPALAGFGGAFLAARGFESYGWGLFLGLPVLVSFLSAFLLRRFRVVSWGRCYGVSLLSLLALGGFLLLFAVDGLICLVMALPLAAVLALVGSALGFHLARKLSSKSAGVLPLVLVALFPVLLGFEQASESLPVIHEVTTALAIAAPVEKVWDEVIAFDRITEPPSGIFRLGIAYPVQARIEGEGVGAIRHCIFSTGPFVEPITVWEPPRLLEFDVVSNPVPMAEFSPYGHIDTPHLHETFVSRHGRFRLTEKDGLVILEGTTWYFQRIAPDWYWHHFSDRIIHQIHRRVLDQIRRQAERNGA